MQFFRKEHYFCVTVFTGPQFVRLLLHLETEPNENPEVFVVYDHPLGLKVRPADVKEAVMSGIAAANKDFDSNYHAWEIRYSIETYTSTCTVARNAAYCVIERLAEVGMDNYAGIADL